MMAAPDHDLAAHSGGASEHSSEAPVAVTGGGISVIGVRKSFGVTRALDGCTFSAAMGEIHAIVGGNGCGKSTLAKVMSGTLPIDAGQVSVLGHAPTTPHAARAIGIATVFQEVLVADECSVIDNLYLGADGLWSKTEAAAARARAAEALMHDLTGMTIDPATPVGTLPLGIKQWITIGRALLCDPKVLILDESSAALDLDSTERLFAKMRQLRDRGAAVLIVTHRIAELIRISDRATVLRDGRDVGVLERREITEKNLLGLMTGRSEAPHVSPAEMQEVLQADVVMKTEKLRIWPSSGEIDVALRKGEILGVAGLDGQGQSEFVRILAGVTQADRSMPLVRDSSGRFAPIRNLADATRFAVAYVSGDRKREGIFANLSIFENLLMPLFRRRARAGRIALVDWDALGGVFDWEVEKLSIRMGARANKITSLSGGNQQKVLIGRAFALNPDILVLNDPARGIDVGAKAELYRHLTDFAARGKSVVYMSSEIEEFVGFCTRLLVFRHGSVFDEFTANAIDPDRILEAMFGQTRSGSQTAGASTSRRAVDRMKIVEFDKEAADTVAPREVGRIKVVDFSAEQDWVFADGPEADTAPAAPRIKIVDFDREAEAAERRRGAGAIKITEFDKEQAADRERRKEPAAGGIKIVEFDRVRR
jgi:ribose transport system ATP-binding protein